MIAYLPAVLSLLWAQPPVFAAREPGVTLYLRKASPSVHSTVQEPDTAEEVLAKVRAAVHYDEWRKTGSALSLTGTNRHEGVDTPFTLQFDSAGRWIDKDPPPLPSTDAFDGARYWNTDGTGATISESTGGAAVQRYLHLLLTDAWLAGEPAVAVTLSPHQTDPNEEGLEVRFKDAELEASVAVSKSTCLPTRASLPGPFTDFGVKIVSWTSVGGLAIPSSVEIDNAGDASSYSVAHGEAAKDDSAETYAMPAWVPADTTFDPSLPTAVETKRASNGFVLVHPRVNGRDVGWFLLDSGASTMFVNKEVAEALHLENLSSVRVTGIEGKTPGWRCKVDTFSLGPLTVKDLGFIVDDTSLSTKECGVPVAGTVGYDIFRRAVLVIPGGQGDVTIPAPIRTPINASTIRFEGRTPLVYLDCERGGGWFELDTGYDGPVTFFAPFSRRTHMLVGRELIKTGKATGLGGKTDFSVGKIGWAKFGDNRLKSPYAAFTSSKNGAWAGRYDAGSIGQLALRLFDITFDYGGPGVSFKPAAGAAGIGNDEGGRTWGSLDPGWVRLVTRQTFYERFLDPGETVSLDVLDPDLVVGSQCSSGTHDRFEPIEQPRGTRVTYTRDGTSGPGK